MFDATRSRIHGDTEEENAYLRRSLFRRNRTGAQYTRAVQVVDNLERVKRRSQKEANSFYVPVFSPFRYLWGIVRLVMSLYLVMVSPLRFGFFENDFHLSIFVDYLCDVFMIVDLMLQFCFFAVVDTDNMRILSEANEIWAFHMSNSRWESVMLIVAAFPFDVAFLPRWEWVYAVRMIKTFHIVSFRYYLNYYIKVRQTLSIDPLWRKILRVFATIVYATHLFACLMYRLGSWECRTSDPAWECAGRVWYTTKDLPGGITERQTEPVFANYLKAVYWSIVTMTTTGYGDFVPAQQTEMAFASMVMLVGWFSYGRLVGLIAPLLDSSTYAQSRYLITMDQLQTYLIAEQVPGQLQRKVLRYFEEQYVRFEGETENAIYQTYLPPLYRREVGLFLLGHALVKVPFLKDTPAGFLGRLATVARWDTFRSRDVVIRKGERSDKLFIVVVGELWVYDTAETKAANTGKTLGHIGTLGPTDCFCHSSFYHPDALAKYTVVAHSRVDIAYITGADLKAELELIRGSDSELYDRTMEQIDAMHDAGPQALLDVMESHTERRRDLSGSCCVCLPGGRFRSVWDLLLVAGVFYYCLIIPFRLTFWLQDWFEVSAADWYWFSIDWAVDSFFLIDIYLNLFHFALDNSIDSARPISLRAIFMTHYWKGGLLLDFIASVPLDVWEVLKPESERSLTLLLIFRVNRLLRVRHINKYYNTVSAAFQKSARNWGGSVLSTASFFSILRALTYTFILFHWLGCIFFFISNLQLEAGEDTVWITVDGLFEQNPADESSPFINATRLRRYVRGIEWAFVTGTTVGYGDITPWTLWEYGFATVFIFFATLAWLYILAQITVFADMLNSPTNDFDQKMSTVNAFLANMSHFVSVSELEGAMRQRRARLSGSSDINDTASSQAIDTDAAAAADLAAAQQLQKSNRRVAALADRVRGFRTYLWTMNKGHSLPRDLLRRFPSHIQVELNCALISSLVQQSVSCVRGQTVFLYMMASQMDSAMYAQHDWICSALAPAFRLFFIVSGRALMTHMVPKHMLYLQENRDALRKLRKAQRDLGQATAVADEYVQADAVRAVADADAVTLQRIKSGEERLPSSDSAPELGLTEGTEVGRAMLGMEALSLSDKSYYRSIRAVQPCSVLVLHRDRFRTLLDDYPEMKDYYEVWQKHNDEMLSSGWDKSALGLADKRLARLKTLLRSRSEMAETAESGPLAAPVPVRMDSVETNGHRGSLMSNAGDAEDTWDSVDDLDLIESATVGVRPDDPRRLNWNMVKTVIMVYFALVVPLRIGFAKRPSEEEERPFVVTTLVVDFVCDCLLLLDFLYLRRFRFQEVVGGDIKEPEDAFQEYKRNGLALDLLITCPLDNLLLLTDNGFRIVFWVRLARLVHLRHYNTVVDKLNSLISERSQRNPQSWLKPGVLAIVNQFILVVVFAHFFACFWWFIAREENKPNSWKNQMAAPVFYDESEPLLPSVYVLADRYWQSLYFAIVSISTVGYGDIKPLTTAETLLVLFLLSVGLVLYGGVTGNIASIVASADALKTAHMARWRKIRDALLIYLPSNHPNLPQMKAYYQRLWDRFKGVEEGETLDSLPTNLREDIAHEMYRAILRNTSVFRRLPVVVARKIAAKLRLVEYMPLDDVLVEGDTSGDMWILLNGSVVTHRESDQEVCERYCYPPELAETLMKEKMEIENNPLSKSRSGSQHRRRSRHNPWDATKQRKPSHTRVEIEMQPTAPASPMSRASLAGSDNGSIKLPPDAAKVESILGSDAAGNLKDSEKRRRFPTFGEHNVLSGRPRMSNFDYEAETHVMALVLNHTDLAEALQEIPTKMKRAVTDSLYRHGLKHASYLPNPVSMRTTRFGAMNNREQRKSKARSVRRSMNVALVSFDWPTQGCGRLYSRTSTFRQWSDIAVLLGIVFHLISIPALAVFTGADNKEKYWALILASWLVDFFFAVEWFFRVFYFVPHDYQDQAQEYIGTSKEIHSYKGVFLHYIGNWEYAILDILALFPMDVLVLLYLRFTGSSIEDANEWLGFWRANHVLFFYRWLIVLRHVEFYATVNPNFVFRLIAQRAGKLFFAAALALHWLACGWFLLGDNINHVQTWVDANDVRLQSPFGRYIMALYWSVTTVTTCGYGDITPQNNYEITYAVFTIFIGTVLYADIIGSIAGHEGGLYAPVADYKHRKEVLLKYLGYRHLPLDLRNKILAWHEYMQGAGHGADEDTVIDSIPEMHYSDVMWNIHQNFLNAVPFLTDVDDLDQKMIASLLQRRLFLDNDVVYFQSDTSVELLFLVTGEVQEYGMVEEDQWRQVLSQQRDIAERNYLKERDVELALAGKGASLRAWEQYFYLKTFEEHAVVNVSSAVISCCKASGAEHKVVGHGTLLGAASFLLGEPRSSTAVAHLPTEALSIARSDLAQVFRLFHGNMEDVYTSIEDYLTGQSVMTTARQRQHMREYWRTAAAQGTSSSIEERVDAGSAFAASFAKTVRGLDVDMFPPDVPQNVRAPSAVEELKRVRTQQQSQLDKLKVTPADGSSLVDAESKTNPGQTGSVYSSGVFIDDRSDSDEQKGGIVRTATEIQRSARGVRAASTFKHERKGSPDKLDFPDAHLHHSSDEDEAWTSDAAVSTASSLVSSPLQPPAPSRPEIDADSKSLTPTPTDDVEVEYSDEDVPSNMARRNTLDMQDFLAVDNDTDTARRDSIQLMWNAYEEPAKAAKPGNSSSEATLASKASRSRRKAKKIKKVLPEEPEPGPEPDASNQTAGSRSARSTKSRKGSKKNIPKPPPAAPTGKAIARGGNVHDNAFKR